MKNITAKKLSLSSVASFALGFGILAFIRLKTQSTSCYYDSCTVLNFLHTWVAPIGQFLFVLSIVLVIASVVVKLGSPKPGLTEKVIAKRQSIIAAVLLVIGSGIFLFSQWKLSNISAYYDRHEAEWYGSLVSPFGGLLFLLGFVILYVLVLKSKQSHIDDRHNI